MGMSLILENDRFPLGWLLCISFLYLLQLEIRNAHTNIAVDHSIYILLVR